MSGAAAHSASDRHRRRQRVRTDQEYKGHAASAISGLAIMSFTNTLRRGGPPRWALAAAVSHWSNRCFVITRRTSVTVIACNIS